MSLLLTKTISAILLPPMLLLILGLVGMAILESRPRFGKALITIMIFSLWVLSMPVVGDNLVRLIEKDTLLVGMKHDDVQAIVVLGGEGGLSRCRYAASLHRRTGLPILVTGGSAIPGGKTDAERLTKMLVHDFRVSVRWQEDRASNTIENAKFSASILKSAGVTGVLLVTDGWHMHRSRKLFENNGISVVPAASNVHWQNKLTPLDFLPDPEGLKSSWLFFHEILGLIHLEILDHASLENDEPAGSQ